MRMYDIILKKRANLALTNEEIRFVIEGYVHGTIPDYQVSALLMTISTSDAPSAIACFASATLDSVV